MMRRIIAWSLQARVLIVAMAAAVLFFGAAQLREMPVDTLPEFTPTTVEIQTEALGLSAAEVEQLITVPLEQNFLNGIAWLEVIRSQSVPGLSSIELIFEPGTDVFLARQVVQERLAEATVVLPGVSRPPQMLQPLSSTNRVMIIGLSSSERSLIEMSVLTRWNIKPQLLGVPGVANVAVYGQRERQLQVQVDPERLRDSGISLSQIISTTGNALWVSPLSFLAASTPGAGGFIDTPNQRIEVQHILPISSPGELAQVPLERCTGATCPPPSDAGPQLRLGDVARVVEDHQPLIGDAVLGDKAGLLLVVEKFPEANTVEVSEEVENAIDALRPGLAGLEFDTTVFRPATAIERGLDRLTVAALVGGALAVLALAVLFFQWRAALISLVAVPLSLVAAGLVLHLRGETFNVMLLAGLVPALGLLIDEVVTDVDRIMRRLRERRQDGSTELAANIVLEAALEARGVLLYATLIIGVAWAPVFFLDGLANEFFPPLAASYLLAVAASLVVAMTVTPALSLFLVSFAPPAPQEPPVGRWLQRQYGAALSRIFGMPRPAFFAAVAVVAVVGLALTPMLSRPSLLPSFKEKDLLIHLDGAPGTSRPEMNRIAGEVSRELRGIDGVRNVGAHVGRAVTSDQVAGVHAGELWVSIDPEADYDATVGAIEGVVNSYPGLARDVVSFPDERVREVLTGTNDELTVRVYGEDLAVLRAKAEEVRQVLSEIDGVVDEHVNLPAEEATVEIEVDLAAAQGFGIKPGDVRRAAATLLSGIEVGSLFEEQKVFEVIVVGTPDTRHSLTSIRELLIDTPGGGHVTLAEVADVRIAPNPNVIEREAVSRRLDVAANVSGRSRSAVVDDVEERLKGVDFPLGYHVAVLDVDGETSLLRLLSYGIAAGIAIFLLLQAALASWRLAALAFVTLPMALVGGVVTAFAAGGDVTIGTYAGFLALLGIATRHGIVLINRYQQLEQETRESIGPALVLRGAQERVGPVLMTALATALALAPMVFLADTFGYEILHPMGIVVLGGLVTSTALNLFILPAFYLFLATRPETAPSRPPMTITDVQPTPSLGGGS